MLSYRFLTPALLGLLLTLAACSDQTYVYPEDQTTSDNYFELASVAPPAPSDEIKPMIDPRTQVWRPGHWVYESQRYNWMPGEILTKPSATAVWSADRWEHREYGYAFVHGYWE